VLSQRFNSRPLIQFDPNLPDLFCNKGIILTELFDFLVTYFAKDCRELLDSNHNRHLVLFNSHDSDFLVYLCLLSKDSNLSSNQNFYDGGTSVLDVENRTSGVLYSSSLSELKAFAVSREWRLHPDPLEIEHVSLIVRSLSFYLWVKAQGLL
jgi:hypothetical protein